MGFIKRDLIRGFEFVDKKYCEGDYPCSIPRRGTSKSAGYDFFSPVDVVIKPGEQVKFKLNVKAYMQDNEVLYLHARSSMGFKYEIILGNSTAVIDADYYNNKETGGNIGIALKNLSDKPFEIRKGDKICQGIFSTYLLADNDDPIAQERVGGIGSTGR